MKPVQKNITAMALTSALAFSAVVSADPARVVSNDNQMSSDTITYQMADVSQQHPAQKLLQEASDNMVTALKENKEELKKNPALIYDLLEDNVLMNFDFRVMSRLSLGKHWRSATKDQRERFTKEYRAMLVRVYAVVILDFSGQKINFLPMRGTSKPNRAKVRTEIEQAGGMPLSINYNLYSKNNQWKIYNVSIEGFSLVSSFRSSFAAEIRRGGLERLIEKLHDKNQSSRLQPS